MATRAEAQLVKQVSGGSVVAEEATRFRVTQLRAALVEPGDTELETMLIHRVALCSVALNNAETHRARLWENGDITTQLADFWDKRVSRLHSDFLKACKTLAQVRRLRRPVIQVNVGDKQINVAGPVAVDARNPATAEQGQVGPKRGRANPELPEKSCSEESE